VANLNDLQTRNTGWKEEARKTIEGSDVTMETSFFECATKPSKTYIVGFGQQTQKGADSVRDFIANVLRTPNDSSGMSAKAAAPKIIQKGSTVCPDAKYANAQKTTAAINTPVTNRENNFGIVLAEGLSTEKFSERADYYSRYIAQFGGGLLTSEVYTCDRDGKKRLMVGGLTESQASRLSDNVSSADDEASGRQNSHIPVINLQDYGCMK